MSNPYEYRVLEVIRVVDGDTVDLRLDLGFHLTTALRFRLLDIDTPERGQAGWAEATAYTREWLTDHRNLWAVTEKADSFGRWLALIESRTPDRLHSLNDDLISAGHAVPYTR